MKNYFWMLLALLLFPSPARKEPGDLIPVEVVGLVEEDGRVLIRTDTGDHGSGRTMEEAVKDLKARAPGTIYLETADYLILWGDPDPEQLLRYLRPSAEICLGTADPKQAAAFMQAHRPEHTIHELRAGNREIPELREEEGGFCLA